MVTTSSVDELIVLASYAIDDTAADRFRLRVEIQNFGSDRFVGNDSAQWAFYEGSNLKKVPTFRFDPLDLTHGAAVFSGSLSDLTIEPGATIELDTSHSTPELDHGLYFGGCIEEGSSPIYENCRVFFQYDAISDEIYESGTRGASAIIVTPVIPEGVTIKALAATESGRVVATLYLEKNCDTCDESLDEASYRAIAYDPDYDEFAAGPPGDVISFLIPSNTDIDLFGLPDDDVWRALAGQERGTFDPANAVAAVFFDRVTPKPSQMVFCIVTGAGNEIFDCTRKYVEGFVGPPVCADGFSEEGRSDDNRLDCAELAQAEGGNCEAEFVGSTVLASSDTVLEVGTSLHLQGCGGANTSITISLDVGDPENPNTATGAMCEPQTDSDPSTTGNGCLLSNPMDGSYGITASYYQCEDPSAPGELRAVTGDDETVASLDIASFCN